MSDSNYYVYLHKTLNGDVFYVGKGRHARWKSKTTRNSEWHEIVKSQGIIFEKYAENLTEEAALALETHLIVENPFNWKLCNSFVHETCKALPSGIDDLLFYDETSPTCLRWKVDRNFCKRIKAGEPAGYFNTGENNAAIRKRYYTLRVNSQACLVHRIIWQLHNGPIPPKMVINHINGDSLDNRIENLECITQAQNSRKTKTQDRESNGVFVHVANGKYFYAAATWKGINGETHSKRFPYSKYGKEEAHRLARLARNEALEMLNKDGAGYSI